MAFDGTKIPDGVGDDFKEQMKEMAEKDRIFNEAFEKQFKTVTIQDKMNELRDAFFPKHE